MVKYKNFGSSSQHQTIGSFSFSSQNSQHSTKTTRTGKSSRSKSRNERSPSITRREEEDEYQDDCRDEDGSRFDPRILTNASTEEDIKEGEEESLYDMISYNGIADEHSTSVCASYSNSAGDTGETDSSAGISDSHQPQKQPKEKSRRAKLSYMGYVPVSPNTAAAMAMMERIEDSQTHRHRNSNSDSANNNSGHTAGETSGTTGSTFPSIKVDDTSTSRRRQRDYDNDSQSDEGHQRQQYNQQPSSASVTSHPTVLTDEHSAYGIREYISAAQQRELQKQEAEKQRNKKRDSATVGSSSVADHTHTDTSHESSVRPNSCTGHPVMRMMNKGKEYREQQQQQQQQQRQKTLQKDTLVENRVGIDWIFLTTYILDVDFLLNELPELVHVPIVVLLYHYKDESPSGREAAWIQRAAAANHRLVFLVRDPRAAAGTVTNPRGPTMGYGCHHTKMTLVRYSSGRLRVHIHTSNMRREDVHDKCQGAFLQDFWPKTEDQLASFVTSGFEESLATYLESYDFRTPMVWIDHDPSAGDDAETLVSHLQTYDFSTAVAVLIPSVPGYHKIHARRDSNNDKIYGYLKVQRAIRDHCGAKTHNAQPNRHRGNGPGSIVCQFSSMGALSKPYLTKLADAWNVDAVTAPSIAGTSAPRGKRPRTEPRGASTIPSFSLLRIVWPTIEEIVTSVEGRNGGASVPGRTKNLHRDFIGPLLHTWRSNSGSTNDGLGDGRCDDLHFGKGRHVPHIKSYYQICNNDDDGDDESDRGIGNAENMRWFVLSSHNLSKAAWGEIQYRRDVQTEVLVVQHWELGVFLAPSTLGVDAMGPLSTPGIFRKGPTTNGTGRIKSPKCVDTDDSSGTRAIIPLPYKFQPDRYRDTDQPWVVA
mmetsp:Transcript_19868/g.46551  ORF Transcript_19868/g.46551 Transcript_19868/m.46551 type:complete len:875 (+) Transcript_19868:139-2763(+)